MRLEQIARHRHERIIMTICTICEITANRVPPRTLEAYGHTVIAPKTHYSNLFTTPDHLLEAVIKAAKKLAVHYKNQIGSSGVNILHASGASAQQSVLHLHFHLIPRFDNDGVNAWPAFSAVQCDKDELLQKLQLRE